MLGRFPDPLCLKKLNILFNQNATTNFFNFNSSPSVFYIYIPSMFEKLEKLEASNCFLLGVKD